MDCKKEKRKVIWMIYIYILRRPVMTLNVYENKNTFMTSGCSNLKNWLPEY